MNGRDDDRVDEAIRESFPASDPPAWTGAVSAPTEERSGTEEEGENAQATRPVEQD